MACLLLNRFCTAIHHDHDDDHSEEWRETAQNSDAPPDRAHPAALRRPASLPSRLRACTSSPQPSSECTPVATVSKRRPSSLSPCEEESMPTTTTTAGPTESQLHRGGTVTSPSLVREKSERPRMVRLTVNLPSHLVEQMRDAVYWTPGLTLAWMIARAVRASLADLETIHQGPFPRRLKPLRAGRPRLVGQSMNVRPLGTGEGDGPGKSVVRAPIPVVTRN